MKEIQSPFVWRGKPVILQLYGKDGALFVCDGDVLNCLSIEWIHWASKKIKWQAPQFSITRAAAAMVKE